MLTYYLKYTNIINVRLIIQEIKMKNTIKNETMENCPICGGVCGIC